MVDVHTQLEDLRSNQRISGVASGSLAENRQGTIKVIAPTLERRNQ